uniref:Uncharacterized protein n=1 Tax=Aegilops tauschii subsp. strangulata TaxID=200361 RepID=A0A453CAT9_AEGTS
MVWTDIDRETLLIGRQRLPSGAPARPRSRPLWKPQPQKFPPPLRRSLHEKGFRIAGGDETGISGPSLRSPRAEVHGRRRRGGLVRARPEPGTRRPLRALGAA